VAQLRQQANEFKDHGARVVLVGLGSVDETAAFKVRFDVPFDMIADPHKQLFGAFGLKRASTGSLLSVGMALKGLTALAKGHGLGAPSGDVKQLPGVFIIDTKGDIRYSHHAADPADHPSPDTLLEVLRADSAD
jgi:alkyl hydroperoxide reductase subunit AhpC